MGFFDDIFGGAFDFNGDEKTTWNEEWIAYKIIEDIEKDTEESDDTCDSLFLDNDDEAEEDNLIVENVINNSYDWRINCEDGSKYDLDPEDFETEYEYYAALDDARQDDTMDSAQLFSAPIELTFSIKCSPPAELDAIKESNYPNKRQFEAAYVLANESIIHSDEEPDQNKMAICHFILEQSSTVVAANYLTVYGGFLFAQAVKEHFSLPVEFPDEDSEKHTFFIDMINEIAKKDIKLSLEIWDWCIEKFMPYAHFEWQTDALLTNGIIHQFYMFPENFCAEFIQYLGEHPEFCHAIFRDCPKISSDTSMLIYTSLQSSSVDISRLMFEDSLINAGNDTDVFIRLINSIILCCDNGDELESMEKFQSELFPLVRKYAGDELKDQIVIWEKEMAEYIRETERYNKKYAFSRCNSWRKSVPDGSEYGLDVRYYHTKKQYLKDLNNKKYSWRNYYFTENCYGLNPVDFETQREFDDAIRKRSEDEKRIVYEERLKRQREIDKNQTKTPSTEIDRSILDDKNIYIYCGVTFQQNGQVYSYRTNDTTMKIGDKVIVPVSNDMIENEAEIVFVGQYTRMTVPFPIEKTRFIIKKVGYD